MLKVCARCRVEKTRSLFGLDKNRKDGLNVYCKPCVRERSLAYCEANRERVRKSKAESVRRHADRRAEWLAANAEKLRAYWRDYGKRYRAEKRAETAEKTRRQQAARRKAVPPWFDREKAAAIYAEAQARRAAGEDVHVDHIVPLNGETVCGLHWHGNLQILTAEQNLAKSNKLTPDP